MTSLLNSICECVVEIIPTGLYLLLRPTIYGHAKSFQELNFLSGKSDDLHHNIKDFIKMTKLLICALGLKRSGI